MLDTTILIHLVFIYLLEKQSLSCHVNYLEKVLKNYFVTNLKPRMCKFQTKIVQ